MQNILYAIFPPLETVDRGQFICVAAVDRIERRLQIKTDPPWNTTKNQCLPTSSETRTARRRSFPPAKGTTARIVSRPPRAPRILASHPPRVPRTATRAATRSQSKPRDSQETNQHIATQAAIRSQAKTRDSREMIRQIATRAVMRSRSRKTREMPFR